MPFKPKKPPKHASAQAKLPTGHAGFTPKAPPGGHTTTAKKKGGGLLHTVGHAVTHSARVVAEKADLGAHDIKSIPGGLIDLGQLEAHALKADASQAIHHPTQTQSFHDFLHGKPGSARATLAHTEKATLDASKQSLAHPGRDPFQTAMVVLPILSGGAAIVARAGAAADAASAASGAGKAAAAAAKALTSKPKMPPRLLKAGDAEVPLHHSERPLRRAAQAGYDKVLQHGLDTKPEGKVAGHAMRRVGGTLDETARAQHRMRQAPSDALEIAGKRLASKKHPGQGRVHQAALELTSVNTMPEKAAAYHAGQAAKLAADAAKDGAKNPAALREAAKRNAALGKLYDTVAKRGLLTRNEHGDVIVAAEHPKLVLADQQLAKVQGRGDEILARYGIRTPEQLTERVNSPGRVREGAAYERPTAAKAGVPSQSLLKAQARVDRLQALHDRALKRGAEKATQYANVHTRTGLVKQTLKSAPEAAFKKQHVEVAPGPKTPGVASAMPAKGITNPTADRIGGALSVAKDELASKQAAAAARVKPTGMLGGEAARPGRGFVSYATHEKKAPQSPAAASTGTVIGEAKAPISSQTFTGQGIAHGLAPNDITGQAARHYKQIVRFVNTAERRNAAIRTGANIRRSERDVLVKIPGDDHAQIPQAIEELLGRKKTTVDDVAGIHAALEAYREDLIPGVADRFAADKQAAVGQDAPEGYKWVDRGALGELARASAGPRGRIARSVDNVNSAVTAATVYFKIGHLGTRIFTNAATNILQGSARPAEIADSVKLWHELSNADKTRALAASGQHGIAALPHEGVSHVSRIASHGAAWWARRIDSPFRFNSIAYEARKAGFNTPEKFRDMLDKLENPHDHNLNAAETAKVEWVAKRANREGIAYDRLNDLERRYVTRGLWFYPWVKGATMYAGHVALEHPYKAGVAAAAGVEGRKMQQAELGDLPTYEGGLFQIKGGAKPLVADFSTFSPFATPADLLNTVSRPSELSGMLNPAYGGVNAYVNGLNRYGDKLASGQNPFVEALATAVAPAPETQILSAYLNRNKPQDKKMFPASPALSGTLSPLLRALVGPGLPRRFNPPAAHASAKRQRTSG